MSFATAAPGLRRVSGMDQCPILSVDLYRRQTRVVVMGRTEVLLRQPVHDLLRRTPRQAVSDCVSALIPSVMSLLSRRSTTPSVYGSRTSLSAADGPLEEAPVRAAVDRSPTC